MPKLILFDIDGTLLWPNGAGRLAIERALTEVYGTCGALDHIYLAGMTDRAIVREALAADGIAPFEIQAKWERFEDAMARHMKITVTERPVEPCPGVYALLDALVTQDEVVLGLVTGNLEITAPIKLRAAGIDPNIFCAGGYGSDASDRNDLPAIAAHRANTRTGNSFAGHSIVVVGDTPADVACGQAVGARTVAVATGLPSYDSLLAAEPDVLLSDLSDLERSLRAILATERP